MEANETLAINYFASQLGDEGTPWHKRYQTYRLAELNAHDSSVAIEVRTCAAQIRKDLNRSGKYSWEPCTPNPRIQATALRILIAQGVVKPLHHVGAYHSA